MATDRTLESLDVTVAQLAEGVVGEGMELAGLTIHRTVDGRYRVRVVPRRVDASYRVDTTGYVRDPQEAFALARRGVPSAARLDQMRVARLPDNRYEVAAVWSAPIIRAEVPTAVPGEAHERPLPDVPRHERDGPRGPVHGAHDAAPL